MAMYVYSSTPTPVDDDEETVVHSNCSKDCYVDAPPGFEQFLIGERPHTIWKISVI